MDGRGCFLHVNETLCKIVGLTREDLLERTFADITHPDDRAVSFEHFHTLMQGELPSFSLEKRYIRKDGSIVWGQVSVSLQRDAEGRPAYAIAVLEDISDRKEAEEALHLASARLNLAVRGSNIGIWEIDMPDGVLQDGRVIFINLWEQFGYDRPDSPTDFATPMSLVHPDDRERLEQSLQSYLLGADQGARDRASGRSQERVLSLDALTRRGRARPGRQGHSPHRQQHRYHRPQAGRGGAARERGAVPRHVRECGRGHRPQRCRGPLAARQPEILRDRRLHPRGTAQGDIQGHNAPR